VLAGIGAFLAAFEHLDGWGGADRGFFGGAIYGSALRGPADRRAPRLNGFAPPPVQGPALSVATPGTSPARHSRPRAPGRCLR
jgi:hypothetical protein